MLRASARFAQKKSQHNRRPGKLRRMQVQKNMLSRADFAERNQQQEILGYTTLRVS
jgi:hypothetical protein